MNFGQEKWNFYIGGEYFYSSPAIGSGDSIYVGSSDGKLHALNPSGRENWNFSTGASIATSIALASDGTIYFGTGGCDVCRFYALNPDGTIKWSMNTWSGSSSPAIGQDGTIYVNMNGNKTFALYPNGTIKWQISVGMSTDSSPAIDPDGTLYFGDGANILHAVYPDGKKKWDFQATFGLNYHIDTSPAIGSDGTIYFGSNDYKLYAINPNGTKKWDFTTGGGIFSSPAIGSDGTIYFGSVDGGLYALLPNGTQKWNYSGGNGIDSSPAISSDGTIFIGSGYNLYAIYPNGTKKWDFNTGDFIMSSPAIGSDGTIYIGSNDYHLFAIGSNPTAPQHLKAIGGDGYVNLTWLAPFHVAASAVTNYTIYRGTSSGTETYFKKIGNVTKYQDTQVTNGQTYYYEVTANNSYGESFRSNEANATPLARPTSPLNLTADPGNKQIILNWTVPAEYGGTPITDYAIYRNSTILTVIGDVRTYIDTDLINGVAYSYRISAINKIGEGPKSNEVIAIPRTLPDAPRDLKASLGNVQIILTWLVPASNGGASITSYRIYRGITPGGESLYVRGYDGGNSWIDRNVVIGTKYYYKVSAVNVAGEGPRSNEANATPYASPGAPSLNATAGNSKIVLTWTVPNSNHPTISNYSIYRGTVPGNETLLIKSYSSGTMWTDTNVTIGTKYYYTVGAVNISGEGPRSNEVNGTPFTLPGSPILNATGGNGKISLSWTLPNSNGASIVNYSIYRGTSPGGEILYITGYTGGISWVDMNITKDIKYYYMVSANNIAGEGPKSNEKNTIAGISPGTPNRFTASEGDRQVVLRWDASKNGGTPAHYNIYRSESRTGNYTFIAISNSTSYKDTGLENDHEYWYKINAQNSYGVSGNTTEVSATPYRTSILNSLLLLFIIVIMITLIVIEATRSSRKKKN